MQIFARERIENIKVPDDRMAQWMCRECRGKELLSCDIVGVIEAHREFAPDDFLLGHDFVRR